MPGHIHGIIQINKPDPTGTRENITVLKMPPGLVTTAMVLVRTAPWGMMVTTILAGTETQRFVAARGDAIHRVPMQFL